MKSPKYLLFVFGIKRVYVVQVGRENNFSLYICCLKRTIYMGKYPIVLAIAGSDCSGGAGIQADIKTISALGGYAASVVTAVTVQNTLGVQDVFYLPVSLVERQILAVVTDLRPDVIKIGMIGSAEIAGAVAALLQQYGYREKIVFDPVMISTSGRSLMDDDFIDEICGMLFPQCLLVTPNLHEVSRLLGEEVSGLEAMKSAAVRLSEQYGCGFLIKGGHLSGKEMYDVLAYRDNVSSYLSERIESMNLHGTGCTLSSAIAVNVAKGYALPEAVRLAKMYVTNAIIAGKDLQIGQGHGPLWHFVERSMP